MFEIRAKVSRKVAKIAVFINETEEEKTPPLLLVGSEK